METRLFFCLACGADLFYTEAGRKPARLQKNNARLAKRTTNLSASKAHTIRVSLFSQARGDGCAKLPKIGNDRDARLLHGGNFVFSPTL